MCDVAMLANHTPRRTRRERRGCNHCVPYAGSLRLVMRSTHSRMKTSARLAGALLAVLLTSHAMGQALLLTTRNWTIGVAGARYGLVEQKLVPVDSAGNANPQTSRLRTRVCVGPMHFYVPMGCYGVLLAIALAAAIIVAIPVLILRGRRGVHNGVPA